MSKEAYKKIQWIYDIPSIIENDVVCTKRLDRLLEDDRKALVYSVVSTLSNYFSQIPDYNSEIQKSDPNYSEKFVKSISDTLPIWLSGLCDLSVYQIIGGLLDILNLKTEYQKWPPKSVMEFYSVCKRPRPAYHDDFSPPKSNLKEIEWDKESFEKNKHLSAIQSLNMIYKNMGRNYKSYLKDKIKKLEEKKIMTKKEKIKYESIKNSIDLIENIDFEKIPALKFVSAG